MTDRNGQNRTDQQGQNRKVMTAMLGIATFMLALAFLSVPLYRLTCRLTGWGGTTQQSAAAAGVPVFDREITVRFDTNTAPGLPWQFRAEQGPETVKVGADGFASFLATNKAQAPVAGTAIYNVTPHKIGKYFVKTQCFCFSRQLLQPGEKMHMPVVFHIDPKIMADRDMDDVKTVTLSYTFYREASPQLETAVQKFTNADAPSGASSRL